MLTILMSLGGPIIAFGVCHKNKTGFKAYKDTVFSNLWCTSAHLGVGQD